MNDLESYHPFFSASDPDDIGNIRDEDLPVTDSSRLGLFSDDIYEFFDIRVIHDELQLHLGQKFHMEFLPAPFFIDPLLVPVSRDLRHHDPGDTGSLQCDADAISRLRPYHCGYLFHCFPLIEQLDANTNKSGEYAKGVPSEKGICG